MKKSVVGIIVLFLFLFAFIASTGAYEALNGPTGVLLNNKFKAYNGYTLFSPNGGIKPPVTWLIDMEGYVVHSWKTKYQPGSHSMLLPNGNLLIGGVCKEGPVGIGGKGGYVQEYDWDGNIVWEYKMCSATEVQHHSFWRMPNGNTLILGWERKSKEEALQKGRKPGSFPEKIKAGGKIHDAFWPDFIREINRAGETVWEWHAWDHIGMGPKKLNINYALPRPIGTIYWNFDWTHGNTVGYIPKTDQVIFNSRNFGEFFLISHKTGEIEYRWGNPSTYDGGKAPSFYDEGDQQIYGQHHVTSLENGNIMLFDNGSERPEGSRSRVVEMDPKTDKIVWEYEAKDSTSFFSYRQGSAQKLPNGNVLVTSTNHGHIFEVTLKKEIVWEFVSPLTAKGPRCVLQDKDAQFLKNHNFMSNMIHRAYRYGPDYPGLKGKDLSNREALALGCPEFWRIYGVTE